MTSGGVGHVQELDGVGEWGYRLNTKPAAAVVGDLVPLVIGDVIHVWADRAWLAAEHVGGECHQHGQRRER